MDTQKSKVNPVASKHTQTNIRDLRARPALIGHGKFKGLAKFVAIIYIVSKLPFQLLVTKYLAVHSKDSTGFFTAYISQILGLATICFFYCIYYLHPYKELQ